jgi:hypothetical protein
MTLKGREDNETMRQGDRETVRQLRKVGMPCYGVTVAERQRQATESA